MDVRSCINSALPSQCVAWTPTPEQRVVDFDTVFVVGKLTRCLWAELADVNFVGKNLHSALGKNALSVLDAPLSRALALLF